MSVNSDSGKLQGKRIEAHKFDTPPPLTEQNQKPPPLQPAAGQVRWWHSQLNLLLCVFVLIAVAAFLFAQLAPPPQLEFNEQHGSQAVAAGSPDSEMLAPWDETRRAQARTDSQDVLSNLLDSKKTLEAKNVEDWAPARFQQALDLAQSGDDYYKLQDYQQAIDTYQAAVNQLDALFKEIPKLVENKVNNGLQALDQGKPDLATEAFSEALGLDEDNIPALNGLQRAGNLNQVIDLMQTALAEEQSFINSDDLAHLQRAQAQLEQALTLDPLFTKAQTTQQRITSLIEDKQFRQAMTEGFGALFAGRYSSANSAFAKALEVRPDDPMATVAFRQSLASNKTSSLQSLLNLAARHEANEQWQNALDSYQVVLQRDPNMVAAKLGQIRSRARAQLDSELRSVLADPLALSKVGQSTKAAKLLVEANAINNKGARLKQQIADLQQGMKATEVDVRVQLTSDGLTDVSLRKAGASRISLGKFDIKKLTLKPGRYVLTGVRLGFRDVRQEIELRPQNSSVQKFSISCDEPVGVATSPRDNDQT